MKILLNEPIEPSGLRWANSLAITASVVVAMFVGMRLGNPAAGETASDSVAEIEIQKD